MDFSNIVRGTFTGATQALSSAAEAVSTKAAELNKSVGKVFTNVMQQVQGSATTKTSDMAEKEITDLYSVSKSSSDPEVQPLLKAVAGIATELSKEVSDAAKSTRKTEAQQTPGEITSRQSGAKKAVGDFMRSQFLFPLRGKENANASARLHETVTNFNEQKQVGQKAEVKKIPVEVGGQKRELEALHMTHGDGKGPTVVVFHSNADTAAGMLDQAKFFHDQGFNVLVPTMGGYPGSSGVATDEESICQDVEAVKAFLHQDCGVQEAGYYGLSIGGALAFQAATGETNQEGLKTMFVIADQTFDTMPNVCSNFLQNNHVPKHIAKLAKPAARLGVPAGKNFQVADGLTQKSDGLNNKAKSENLQREGVVPVFSMTAKSDLHMGGKEGNLASKLQANERCEMQLVQLPWEKKGDLDDADHCSKFTWNPKASGAIRTFIAPHKPQTST